MHHKVFEFCDARFDEPEYWNLSTTIVIFAVGMVMTLSRFRFVGLGFMSNSIFSFLFHFHQTQFWKFLDDFSLLTTLLFGLLQILKLTNTRVLILFIWFHSMIGLDLAYPEFFSLVFGACFVSTMIYVWWKNKQRYFSIWMFLLGGTAWLADKYYCESMSFIHGHALFHIFMPLSVVLALETI